MPCQPTIRNAQHLQPNRRAREEIRREAYHAIFKAHLDQEIIGQIRNAANGNYALGRERFQKEIEAALGRRARRGQAGRPSKVSIDDESQLGLL